MTNPPVNGPGVTGGSQPSSEPSQAADDAQQAARPFSTSEASGGENQRDMVPRGMLDRITKKMEGQQAELEQLRALASQPKREGYAEEAAKLQREAAKYATTDPDRMVELLTQASALTAKSYVNETLEGLMSQQAQQSERARNEQALEQSWQRALKDYPELQDQNSDLYKSAFEIWSQDPYRDNDPTSMYKAAVIANERRLRSGKSQPPALEGGNAPTDLSQAGSVSYDDVKRETLAKMRAKGGVQALSELLAPNFDQVLSKPRGYAQ